MRCLWHGPPLRQSARLSGRIATKWRLFPTKPAIWVGMHLVGAQVTHFPQSTVQTSNCACFCTIQGARVLPSKAMNGIVGSNFDALADCRVQLSTPGAALFRACQEGKVVHWPCGVRTGLFASYKSSHRLRTSVASGN